MRLRYGVLLGVTLGLLLGVGGFTFIYAKGASYLTNDPRACANCHIMEEQYAAWQKSSHRAVAVCNDCHTPHSFLGKYTTKALNGFWHSFYFTTGTHPDPVRITPRNANVTEQACRYCHAPITHAIDPAPATPRAALRCVSCHRNAGHLH